MGTQTKDYHKIYAFGVYGPKNCWRIIDQKNENINNFLIKVLTENASPLELNHIELLNPPSELILTWDTSEYRTAIATGWKVCLVLYPLVFHDRINSGGGFNMLS